MIKTFIGSSDEEINNFISSNYGAEVIGTNPIVVEYSKYINKFSSHPSNFANRTPKGKSNKAFKVHRYIKNNIVCYGWFHDYCREYDEENGLDGIFDNIPSNAEFVGVWYGYLNRSTMASSFLKQGISSVYFGLGISGYGYKSDEPC